MGLGGRQELLQEVLHGLHHHRHAGELQEAGGDLRSDKIIGNLTVTICQAEARWVKNLIDDEDLHYIWTGGRKCNFKGENGFC